MAGQEKIELRQVTATTEGSTLETVPDEMTQFNIEALFKYATSNRGIALIGLHPHHE
jgi:hypothetical protein